MQTIIVICVKINYICIKLNNKKNDSKSNIKRREVSRSSL